MNMTPAPSPRVSPECPPGPPLRATLLHQLSTVNAVASLPWTRNMASELQRYGTGPHRTERTGRTVSPPLHSTATAPEPHRGSPRRALPRGWQRGRPGAVTAWWDG